MKAEVNQLHQEETADVVSVEEEWALVPMQDPWVSHFARQERVGSLTYCGHYLLS
jgi:hypothetical protein